MNFFEYLDNFSNQENREKDASSLMICLLGLVFLFIFVLSGVSLLAGMNNP